MPRQPYLPRFADLPYSIGALVPKERPYLCEAIGKCIAIWTHVDNEMGGLFSLLLGTQSEAALEVFLFLRQARDQRAALKAAAKYALFGFSLKVFSATMTAYLALEKERNALSHGCFGICPTDENILFWIDVKEHVHFHVEALTSELKGKIGDDRHKRLKENLFVYRKSDLDKIYDDMEKFWWWIFEFNNVLRRGPPIDETTFHKLCTSPHILAEIARLNEAEATGQQPRP